MAMRVMTASELAEYYTLYAAVGLSRMNQGQDIEISFSFNPTDVAALTVVACHRSRVRLLNPLLLNVDDTTFVPDEATITAMT